MCEENSADFLVEYAKSARSKCKGCQNNIKKGVIRIGKQFPSPFYDGLMTTWFHMKCFFKSGNRGLKKWEMLGQRDGIRSEDQKALKEIIAKNADGDGGDDEKEEGEDEKKKKKKKKGSDESYSSSSSSSVKKKKKKKKGGSSSSSSSVKKKKKKGAKQKKRKRESESESEEPVMKKRKMNVEEEKKVVEEVKKTPEEIEMENKLNEENDILWKVKDNLKKELKNKELKRMLELNDQSSRGGEQDLLYKCAFGMTFGKMSLCPECEGHISFENGTFLCNNKNKWGTCSYKSDKHELLEWKLPKWKKSGKISF